MSSLSRQITNAVLDKTPQVLTNAFFRVRRKSFMFSHDKGTKFIDTYELKEKLGEGNYGSVYSCLHKSSGDIRAVKVLQKKFIKEEAYYNEIDTLKEMDNPNIMKFHESFEDDNSYFVVTELCDGGELFEEILEWGKFTEDGRFMFCVWYSSVTAV